MIFTWLYSPNIQDYIAINQWFSHLIIPRRNEVFYKFLTSKYEFLNYKEIWKKRVHWNQPDILSLVFPDIQKKVNMRFHVVNDREHIHVYAAQMLEVFILN